MIYIRPRNIEDVDQELRDILDADGWFTLPADVSFKANDFKIAVVRIDNIIYSEDSAVFHEAYNKHKAWDILSHDTA